MGRTVPSNPALSPSQRRDARAKRAKQTLNKNIPALLSSYPRAKRGVEGAEVFGPFGVPVPTSTSSIKADRNRDSEVTSRDGRKEGVDVNHPSKGKGRRKSTGQAKRGNREGHDDAEGGDGSVGILNPHDHPKTVSRQSNDDARSETRTTTTTSSDQDITNSRRISPHIRIRVADTLKAAHGLLYSLSTSGTQHQPQPQITILNMCSPLRPGGGFLSGATSQEESLCMRTTLYPSLREEFYRLPEVGGVYTSDVLVFRSPDAEAKDLSKAERWWVDVVSAGMLRFPEVEEDEEGEVRYVNVRDRESVEDKMRAVMRAVEVKSQKSKKSGRSRGLVLGAWGCGAYGNPVSEVAECWKRVLIGDMDDAGSGKGKKAGNGEIYTDSEEHDREKGSWSDMEIVFAIKERKMATQFAHHFCGNIEVEMDQDLEDDEASAEDGKDAPQSESQVKVAELKEQIAASRSEVQKEMLTKMLQNLQLNEGNNDLN